MSGPESIAAARVKSSGDAVAASGRLRLVNRSGYDTGDLVALLDAAERVARADRWREDPGALAQALRAALDRSARRVPHPVPDLRVWVRCASDECDHRWCYRPAMTRVVVLDGPPPREARAGFGVTPDFVRGWVGDRLWVRPPCELPCTPIVRLLRGGPAALPPDFTLEIAHAFHRLFRSGATTAYGPHMSARGDAELEGLTVRVRAARLRRAATARLAGVARSVGDERRSVRPWAARLARREGVQSAALEACAAYEAALADAEAALRALHALRPNARSKRGGGG